MERSEMEPQSYLIARAASPGPNFLLFNGNVLRAEVNDYSGPPHTKDVEVLRMLRLFRYTTDGVTCDQQLLICRDHINGGARSFFTDQAFAAARVQLI